MQEEYGGNFITVTDEDGNEFELEHLDTIEWNGQTYLAFFPAEQEGEETPEEELGLVILKAIQENGEEMLSTPDSDEDEMMMTVLDAGAEDMQTMDDAFEVTTDPNDFSVVREKLEAQGLTFLSAEVQMIPQNTVVPADEDTLQKVQKLLEMLEDNDDVQNVWHNAELPEEPDEE